MSNRHKHADLIHAWAEGAEIEMRSESTYPRWIPVTMPSPQFADDREYRIKPEKKPDVVITEYVDSNGNRIRSGWTPNLKLTFCGETGKLIKAEVL